MTAPRHVAVIDIGKTNAKLALVDLAAKAEVAVTTRPNRVLQGPPWPHFDAGGHWDFILDALARFHGQHGIGAVSVTTHGACAALLADGGSLAAPVLDYEHAGPEELAADYDAIRPPFAETGSPRLPLGLNLGAQLHWMIRQDPSLPGRTAQVVTWPQYWGHRLTGRTASDVTSLGCHTDLWNPWEGQPSSLLARLGLAGRLAPPRRPGDVLGPILPRIAAGTGLPAGTPVAVGIHDSNASLLPHLLAREPPFAVVSTGTWVVCMAVGGRHAVLDPARDTLVNVSALGHPIPSARFMGGREYETIRQGRLSVADAADEGAVLARRVMLLPSVQTGSGPFPNRRSRWTADPADGEAEVALGFYLALMTAECLGMIGADGPVIVEGPFARNRHYRRMLATATGQTVLAAASRTGTAIGAALLFADGPVTPAETEATGPDPALRDYAEAWRRRAAETTA